MMIPTAAAFLFQRPSVLCHHSCVSHVHSLACVHDSVASFMFVSTVVSFVPSASVVAAAFAS